MKKLSLSGQRVILILFAIMCFGCASSNVYRSQGEGVSEKEGVHEKEKGLAKEEVRLPHDNGLRQEARIEEKRTNQPVVEASSPPQIPIPAPPEPEIPSPPQEDTLPRTNQELLDSALDYVQASNDFWEQGDLDNALDALDKAYSIVLKVNRDSNPEVLQQKEDLRVTIAKRIIEVYSSRFTAVNGYHKAIPLEMNIHVERALKLFEGKDREFFLRSYKRSGRYRPAIVEALKEAGLPEELSWLPLIESGFKVRALSRARALGLWQFIASTGYKFGLKRNQWVDERMDPEKSTRAAIAYLKELHQIFGDWSTVLAAYNCGERRVLNHIHSQKINYLDNFWDLYTRLPSETAFYVPKFLAVLHILNDPDAHGFQLPPVDEPFQNEEVTINKQIHLKTIAEPLQIDYEDLRELNPELRYSSTPPGPYSLKVPVGRGEILLSKLDDIPVWKPPVPSHVVHRVRPGESLSVIARRYGTSVNAIVAMNGLRSRNYVKAGWRLKIPARGTAFEGETAAPTKTAKLGGEVVEYAVRKGDSLWKIANRFGTTTKAIGSLNHLDSSLLRVGQVLKIAPGPTAPQYDETQQYRVRKGDSPYIIAKRYRMNLSEFLTLNNLTPRSTIFPGQIVLVKAR
jgi:membrane-bound lytic murein transglycosylase D